MDVDMVIDMHRFTTLRSLTPLSKRCIFGYHQLDSISGEHG